MPKLCVNEAFGSCGRNIEYQCYRSSLSHANANGYCCKNDLSTMISG